jgi:hypothetical protein
MAEVETGVEAEIEKEYGLTAKAWLERLKDYNTRVEDKWKTQRENLDKLYSREDRADKSDRQYSIFWANIEVLKPVIYARPPVPVVAPRFKQPNPLASAASDILERSLITTFEQHDIDGCMQEVRDEFLRYARGTAWLRLDMKEEYECVEFDFVEACDFAHDPTRTWREVKWVGRRGWYTKEEGRERFGEYLEAKGYTFDDIPLQRRDDHGAAEGAEEQAAVWEFWDKANDRVVWVAEEFTHCFMDEREPWLDLSSFWPCPRPAFGTLVPGKMKPVPDVLQYKDQIEEVNELTARISALSEWLRMKGFYPAGMGEASEAIEAALKSLDNRATLIPISGFGSFGNVSPKDAIIWLPVEEAGSVVKGLVELRRVLIDDIYQITGISDILRGETESDETATAQQIKAQWGGTRIKSRQNELQRFARDMTRIAAEIISENFQPETVKQMTQSNMLTAQDKQQQIMQAQQIAQQQAMQTGQPPQPTPKELMDAPTFEDVMAFLADERARGFTIEVETDSTIMPDEQAEKQRATEFITAVGGLITQSVPVLQAFPQSAPFFGELLKFGTQRFRAGRPMEAAIDQLVDTLVGAAEQAQQPPPPDPKLEVEKAKAEGALAKTQMDGKRDQEKHGMEMEALQAKKAMSEQEMAQEWERLAQDQQRAQMAMAQQAMQPRTNGRA